MPVGAATGYMLSRIFSETLTNQPCALQEYRDSLFCDPDTRDLVLAAVVGGQAALISVIVAIAGVALPRIMSWVAPSENFQSDNFV